MGLFPESGHSLGIVDDLLVNDVLQVIKKIGAPAVNRTRARGLGNRCSIQLSYGGERSSIEGIAGRFYITTHRGMSSRRAVSEQDAASRAALRRAERHMRFDCEEIHR